MGMEEKRSLPKNKLNSGVLLPLFSQPIQSLQNTPADLMLLALAINGYLASYLTMRSQGTLIAQYKSLDTASSCETTSSQPSIVKHQETTFLIFNLKFS
jgi:hypothetical protein